MIAAGLEGFGLGAGFIIAIGAQNAMILRQGLLREHVFVLCLVASLADALLICLGVSGVGTLVQSNQAFLYWISLGGALFLMGYGFLAWWRALNPSTLQAAGEGGGSLKPAMMALLAFTFLNPHVYLDTVVLLGGISASHQGNARFAFALGAVVSSFTWFFCLGYGARWLRPLFENPQAWRILDFLIGLIMFMIAFSLIVRVS